MILKLHILRWPSVCTMYILGVCFELQLYILSRMLPVSFALVGIDGT